MSSPPKPLYLVVMNMSERARPLSLIALPASNSFLYDWAVSARANDGGISSQDAHESSRVGAGSPI